MAINNRSKFDVFLYEHDIQLTELHEKLKEAGYTAITISGLSKFKNKSKSDNQDFGNITLYTIIRICFALTAISGERVTPDMIIDYEKAVDKGMQEFRKQQHTEAAEQ